MGTTVPTNTRTPSCHRVQPQGHLQQRHWVSPQLLSHPEGIPTKPGPRRGVPCPHSPRMSSATTPPVWHCTPNSSSTAAPILASPTPSTTFFLLGGSAVSSSSRRSSCRTPAGQKGGQGGPGIPAGGGSRCPGPALTLGHGVHVLQRALRRAERRERHELHHIVELAQREDALLHLRGNRGRAGGLRSQPGTGNDPREQPRGQHRRAAPPGTPGPFPPLPFHPSLLAPRLPVPIPVSPASPATSPVPVLLLLPPRPNPVPPDRKSVV